MTGIAKPIVQSVRQVKETFLKDMGCQLAPAPNPVKQTKIGYSTRSCHCARPQYHYHYSRNYLDTITSVVRRIPLGRST